MEETKRCPHCGEEILAVAHKCKHCGEWLDEKPIEKEESIDEEEQEREGLVKHYFFDVLTKHFFDFGRCVTRKEFWLYQLFCCIFFVILFAVLILIGSAAFGADLLDEDETFDWSPAYILYICVLAIVYILLIIPSLAIQVARLRDAGFHWVCILLQFVPSIGSIILFVLFCMEGKKKNIPVKMNLFDHLFIYIIPLLLIVGCIISCSREL